MLRIVTVAYRNADIIKRLHDSLLTYVKVPFEFLVWDNSERSLNFTNQASTERKICYYGEGKNLGFSRAVNKAVSTATDNSTWDSLLLINPDAFLASEITSEIILKLNQLNGLVGLRVFNDKQKTIRQRNARSFPGFWTSLAGREGVLTRLFPNNPLSRRYLREDLAGMDKNETARVDWVSGCALFCPRGIWEKLQGFDEQFFLYVEDVDLGRKALQAGIPVYYAPTVDVIHESRTTANARAAKSDLHHHIGMIRYFWKWSNPLTKLLFPIVAIGGLTRFALRRLLGAWGRTTT